MKNRFIYTVFITGMLFSIFQSIFSQSLNYGTDMETNVNGVHYSDGGGNPIDRTFPNFSFVINDSIYYSTTAIVIKIDGLIEIAWDNLFYAIIKRDSVFSNGERYFVSIKNSTSDTIVFENLVPFGQFPENTYITGEGVWSLARTKLFRPGKEPLGVILPDNAWEMGYGSINSNDGNSLCAIARRKDVSKGKKRRYKTYLFPGGTVNYEIYTDKYSGQWQNGLKLMFRDRFLYDLDKFDNSLFERKDLAWIRNDYLMILQFAWDHSFYDEQIGGYYFKEFLEAGKNLFGGYDVFGIWPTWPALGVDQRNQWDLYADLPGGLEKLKELSQWAKQNGTKFFIAYNPWDQSTRKENPYEGMARLIKAVDADGVVLDTKGSSSIDLQQAADSVKPGVVMYSEGMAVTKDMPVIISGRVHDAIFMPPPLNLNKFIKPDFAIFRVCQLSQGRIHREVAISLFNGYGIELNKFAPGRPSWMQEELRYLGKAVKILRENSSVFNSQKWIPLISTEIDNIWVNEFPTDNKTIFTVYNLIPEGYYGSLFRVAKKENVHYISLWNHLELTPDTLKDQFLIPVQARSFDKSFLGKRREGSVDCIAEFRVILQVNIQRDLLSVHADEGDKIVIWAGDPSYDGVSFDFKSLNIRNNLYDLFGRYEGKFVIQLFDKDELLDEKVIYIKPGTPRLISKVVKTPAYDKIPGGMVKIPAGKFKLQIDAGGSFIPYPDYDTSNVININSFYIDKYPVTNKQFHDFMESTGYMPKDTSNFLYHWKEGEYPFGMKNYPVVYINYEDANAYADWTGKRLPTEAEWQYAAQGTDGRLYPWGDVMKETKCNLGMDKMTAVNKYPDGVSPFGVADMVGNVWQLTNDIYDNGSYYFIIMRGGSYYNPTSSWWYVKGGPQPLNKTQMLLRVSPGFERNSTVGFRCVFNNVTE